MKLTIQVDEQRILDLVTNAMEGPGSTYWCKMVRKEKPAGMEHLPMTCEEIVKAGGNIILEDIEADDGRELLLNMDSAVRGLEIMARDEKPWHLMNLLSETDDSETADVWLQCALLGKSIYG